MVNVFMRYGNDLPENGLLLQPAWAWADRSRGSPKIAHVHWVKARLPFRAGRIQRGRQTNCAVGCVAVQELGSLEVAQAPEMDQIRIIAFLENLPPRPGERKFGVGS
jgi:hypothetical protein